jgi:hypothetical protein
MILVFAAVLFVIVVVLIVCLPNNSKPLVAKEIEKINKEETTEIEKINKEETTVPVWDDTVIYSNGVHSGIGDNISGAIASHMMALDSGKKWVVHWPIMEPYFNFATFESTYDDIEILSTDGELSAWAGETSTKEVVWKVGHHDIGWKSVSEIEQSVKEKGIRVLCLGNSLVQMYKSTTEESAISILEQLRVSYRIMIEESFVPKESITSHVNPIVEWSDAIIHLRTGDFVGQFMDDGDIENISRQLAAVLPLNVSNVFICSDSSAHSQLLATLVQDTYSVRRWSDFYKDGDPKHTCRDRPSDADTIRAISEFMLFFEIPVVIGCSHSNFSRLGAIINAKSIFSIYDKDKKIIYPVAKKHEFALKDVEIQTRYLNDDVETKT